MLRPALVFAILTALAVPAEASCRMKTGGAKCVTAGTGFGAGGSIRFVQARRTAPVIKVGEVIPDDILVMGNTRYYGLPPVRDGWLYFRVGGQILRADRNTRIVLEDATLEANRAF